MWVTVSVCTHVRNRPLVLLLCRPDDSQEQPVAASRTGLERELIVPIPQHLKIKDLNHPDDTADCPDGCTCNPDQHSDGIDDLSLKFRPNEFADVLGLSSGGDVITIELSGVLEDGTPFCARDCIRLVPQGN